MPDRSDPRMARVTRRRLWRSSGARDAMRQSVRVIIFNGDEGYSATLRAMLLSIDGVQIVADIDEPGLLEQAVGQFPADLLLMHLDPAPEVVMPMASEIARNHPELAVFVVSQCTDGQTILSALRAGIREFLTKPIEQEVLCQAIGKVAHLNESSQGSGKLISVLGTIGGAGASTVATNLAVELMEFAETRPVAVVDLDFRYGQLGTMLDLQTDYTIADLCDTPEQLDAAVIERAMVKHASGIHLLARPHQFGQADQITAAHCASVLSQLQQLYDYVVVDGPHRFDVGGQAVLDLADVNILLIQLLVTSVRNVHRMLEELRDGGYNLDRFHLVCNRVGLESAHLELEHVEQTIRREIFHQLPDDWKTVSSAINMGVPLRDVSPKSRVRLAMNELARLIASPENADEQEEAAKAGLLGRIFSA